MKNYELHPLCTFFPRMDEADFQILKMDIATHGQTHPIYTLDGMILDGGNRYRALCELGIEPKTVEYTGNNPVQFVLSSNLRRRHLTPGQAAAIISATQDWAKANSRGGDRKSDQSATLHFDSTEDRADQSGASIRTQKMADKLVKEAPPELVKEVTNGKKSLPKALEEIAPAKPKLTPKPRPSTDFDANREIDRLIAENDELKERLGEISSMLEELQAENESMTRVLDANDQVTAALAEAKRYREQNRILEERIRGLMNEKNGAIRAAKSWQRKAEKANAA
jgi:flagellar biosynthesis/type III secretory pathway chaperone